MPTLLETIKQASSAVASTSIKLQKTRKEVLLEPSQRGSNIFCSVNVPIKNVTLVAGRANCEDGPILIDANVDKISKLNSGHVPKVVVLGGLNKLRAAKHNHELYCSAWVGNKALKSLSIKASDAISSSELSSKVQAAIYDTYGPKKVNGATSYDYNKSPWVSDIFPYENYVVYTLDGNQYRQDFTFDSDTRKISLVGKSVQVHSEYIPNIAAAFNNPGQSQAQMVGPCSDILVTYGAPNSEANRPLMMSNVEEALLAYGTEIATNVYSPTIPANKPLSPLLAEAVRECEIAAKAYKIKKLSVPDFISWQNKRMKMKASEQSRFEKDGELFASDYAYVGDTKDISTWLLPKHTVKAAKSSLKMLASTPGIPKSQRKEVRERLELICGGPGSGRKPEWSHTTNSDKLEKLHKQLTNKGYKFSHQHVGDKEMSQYVYVKIDSLGNHTDKMKKINNRKNGFHNITEV